MGITAAYAVPHPPLIIPAVGRGDEKGIQKTIDAYEETARRLAAYRPETIVLLSPHQTMYADYFHISPGDGAEGDFGRFGAGQVRLEVSYDTEFVETLCRIAEDGEQSGGVSLPAGTLGERDRRLDHGTMVPLYFVNKYWREYRLVRIGLSGLPLDRHFALGQCIAQTAETLGRSVVLIASGDLSHKLKEDGPYGYAEEGPEYDRRVMDVLARGALRELLDFPEHFCERAAECGHRSFTIMAGALDGREVKAQMLSYEGPFGVGYGVCAFETTDHRAGRDTEKMAEQIRNEDAYVQLARRTIEEYTRTGVQIEVPQGLPEEMYEQRAGAFVSIKKAGDLRGCIGTIRAVQPSVAEEIIANAISAASQDPRFFPVRPDELAYLEISVDVLGDTEEIASPDELDVKRYGVIVTKGYRRGLLLPNLEGVDTVEEQIEIARRKAGIGPDEAVRLERFEVVRHE